MEGRLNYDEELIEELRRVYGTQLNEFLQSLLRPNPRLYLRLIDPKLRDGFLEKYDFFKGDEDFEEAIYAEVKGPNKVEEHEGKVVVDKRTAESVMLGANVYAPGVLKVLAKTGETVSVVSENGVLVAEGKLVNEGTLIVRVENSLYSAPRISELEEVIEGKAYSQGKASMYVARLLDPRPGELIVDMTAAPGGKLTHVAQLEPKARVIGFDRTTEKVEKVRALVMKMGLKNVEVYKADSRYLYEDFGLREADKVIIDPPCSNLGVRPKVYDKKTIKDVLDLAQYQRQFLNAAYKILKRGGVLIYSTCTVTLKENEEVINDERFEVEYQLRFHPHISGLTGFFIAKLVKK
ncbi:MAG: RsmB/NOP family class I SAM-dependent RNA methyltransferase [Sulfolobales archaeon]|nr:RsmB/NOP family class I SAM-dependent RNA methyltransferase [Sulfolobales archaeon]